ncbi:MAG: SRPBCC family protein [bacterium]|nr:SRPBCC family protein [bacterium]
MKITDTFDVDCEVDAVWALFEDLPELAQCLPGAELTEHHDDGRCAGQVEAKLGPITATFDGEATVVSDTATRTGTVSGKGVDRRGGSRAQLTVAYKLLEIEGGTRVTVDADVVLSGAAAQFGRIGLLKEMTGKIIGEFVQCVEAKLSAPTPEAAAEVHAGDVKGISLLLSSMVAPLVRLFNRVFRRN